MEKKENVKVERVIRVDEDYLGFVEECIKKGLKGEMRKEKYEGLGYVWENRGRVIGRSNREGLKDLKYKVLSEKGIKKEDIIKLESELNKRESVNFLSIKV